jgi:HTH-type transcriptional regulator/antitoxin HigA
MKELVPAQVRPPGAILKRELAARGWTQKDLAQILGRPPQVITEIIRGTKQITPDTALELGAAFGNAPRLWTNLETEYRLHLARMKHPSGSSIERRAKIFQRLPIAEIVRRGWIGGSSNVDELERQVCEFLDIKSIDEDRPPIVNYRRSTDAEDVVAAQHAWVRRIEIVAARQRVKGRFSADRLRAALGSIRALARAEEDVAKVPPLLNSLGIRFVIVTHLPRTKVDGAAARGPEGPIVAVSLRYNRIDWFWFTLMHELAHLALSHQKGHLDIFESGSATDDDERDANQYAGEALLRQTALDAFLRAHRRSLSKEAIEVFAASEQLHPGIVVGRLHFEKVIPFSHHRSYLVRVGHYLQAWTDPA